MYFDDPSSISDNSNKIQAVPRKNIAKVLDDFESKKYHDTTTTVTNFLNIKADYSYIQLRKNMQIKKNCSEEDIAASVIQRNYRKYRTRSKFIRFLNQYKTMHERTYSPYFYCFALLANLTNENRSRFFNLINRRLIWGRKLSRTHQSVSFSSFNVINQFMIPYTMDEDKLVKFVRIMYAHRIRQMLIEWRIIARKASVKRKKIEGFRLDHMNRHCFRLIYVPFTLWLRYSKEKHNRKYSPSGSIPEWDNYNLQKKQMLLRKNAASEHYNNRIASRGLYSLRSQVLEKQREQTELENSNIFRLKQNMRFALKGWLKFISKKKDTTNSMKYSLFKWLRVVQVRKHTRLLMNLFKKRHETYQLRLSFGALIKNNVISKVLSINSYIKIYEKPSLALYLVHSLLKDENSAALCKAMNGWIQYVRKRRLWQQFVFSNILKSDYQITKIKTIRAIRHKDMNNLPSQVLFSKDFRKETIGLYQDIIEQHNEPLRPFLVLGSTLSNIIQSMMAEAKTSYQQRDAFFRSWFIIPQNESLFTRVCILHTLQKSSNSSFEKEPYHKRVKALYEDSVSSLVEMGFGSEDKFLFLLKKISENNLMARSNRNKCQHRNRMIIIAHESHLNALDLQKIHPVFRSINDDQINQKIIEETKDVTSFLKPVIPLTYFVGPPNTQNDTFLTDPKGCKSSMYSFRKELIELRNKIKTDRIRSEIGFDTITRFDSLIGGSSQSFAQKNIRTNTRIESYSRNLEVSKPKPRSGMNDKLNRIFRVTSRRPRVLSKETLESHFGKFVGEIDEKEEEDSKDLSDEEGKPILPTNHSNLSLDRSNRSQFFGDMSNFVNVMKTTSMKIFEMSKSFYSNNEDNRITDIEEENSSGSRVQSTPDSPRPQDLKKTNSIIGHPTESIIEQTIKTNGYAEGFSDELMQSISQSENPNIPDADSKYKLFLEILFGNASRESTFGPLNSMKKRLISEFKTRKASMASHGIVTKGITRPVTSLVEKYRDDKDYELSFDESISQRAKIVAKKGSEITEFECKYNSRKFKPFPRNVDNGENEEDQSEPNSFREDLMENDHGTAVNVDNNNNGENNDDVPDSDIDAASKTKPDNNSKKNGMYSFLSSFDSQGVNNGSAMNTVNKVVFKILEDYVKDEDGEIELVDVDKEMPGLDLSKLNTGDGSKPSIVGPRKPGFQRKQRKITHYNNQSSELGNRARVIPDQKEFTNSMRAAIKEEELLTKVILDNGKSKTIKSSHQKPNISKPSKSSFKINPLLEINRSFPLEGQVVSFAGGKRSTGTNSVNFNTVKINQSKFHGLTRPVTASVTLKPYESKRPTSPSKGTDNNKNLKIVCSELIRLMIDTDNEEKRHFDIFYRKLKISKHRPSTSISKFEDLYPKVQSLFVRHIKQRNTEETGIELIKLANEYHSFESVLIRECERALQEKKQRDTKLKKTKSKLSSSDFKPQMAIDHVEMPWFQEKLDYNAVALQYRDEPGCNLDAMIAPTQEKSRVNSRKSQTKMPMTPSWTELLSNYDLNEMLLITPMVVPEKLVDEFLNNYK